MSATEAQKRASKKYRDKMLDNGGLKRILVDFYPADHDLYEWIKGHAPMATYIKNLVREDMRREQGGR